MRLVRGEMESPMHVSSARLGMALAGIFGAAAGAALVGGYAAAQDDTDTEAATSEVSARRRSDLTPAEQVEEAQGIQRNGEALSRRLTSLLDEARRENDVIRVTCIDDKLTQVNAHNRTLGDRVESLQQAVQLGDEGRRNHEFTVISVLAQNLTELDRAAGECIGQDQFNTGTTRVTTTIDPTVPEEDPSAIAAPPSSPVPFIPPPASPS